MAQPKTGKRTPAEVWDEVKQVAFVLGKDPLTITHGDMDAEGNIPEKRILQAGGLNRIKQTFAEHIDKDDAKIRDMDQVRGATAKLRREKGDIGSLLERIENAVDTMKPVKTTGFKAKRPKGKYPRTVQTIFSDSHFGLDLDPRETIHKYGPVEEARAVACLSEGISLFKLDHRSETDIIVNILGDIIENQLHAGGAQEELHLQVCRAIDLLVQYLDILANNFARVTVNFSVGNHGRDKSIHPQRATASKYNAVETSIYYAVRKAFRNAKNVVFNQPMTPWVDYWSHGHRFYACHGDTNFSVGNPGKSINMASIEAMVNKINASQEEGQKYSVFMFGHLHQFFCMQLSNGVWIIGNGALCPPNPFAQTLNIMSGPQNQALWETTKSFPVGDIRAVNVEGSATDERMDKIITPWEGL